MKRVTTLCVVMILGSLTAACGGTFLSPRQALDGEDPYVAFTRAVTAIEPLVDPEFESLTSVNQSSLSSGENAGEVVQLPAVSPLNIEGDMALVTSPELLPLNEILYERFIQAGYSGVIDMNTMTASRAVQQFCQQQTLDILTINRQMTPAEQANCAQNGRQPIAFPLGKDALLLVVHQQATFVQGIALVTLRTLLTRATWSDVRAGWPDQPIQRQIIGPDSAAVTLLAETLLGGNTGLLVNAPNTTFYDYPEPLIQTLSVSNYGLGVVNYSTYQQISQALKTVPINGISASPDTIQEKIYPLWQTTLVYADKTEMSGQQPNPPLESPLVSNLVNFYLTHINDVIPDVSLLPLTPSELNDSKTQWLTITGRSKALASLEESSAIDTAISQPSPSDVP